MRSDARLVVVAAIDGQCARAVDGQHVTTAQFYAFGRIECGACAKIQYNIAIDGDTRVDIFIFINIIFTGCQCCRSAGNRSNDCHE